MNLCGSIFSITLGFIYPYALYRKAFYHDRPKKKKLIDLVVLILGIIGGLFGIYSVLAD